MVKVVENGERICTVTLDGSESSIVFQNDYKYFAVKNESNAAVYVSLTRDIVEGADGVMTIGSKESALFAHMKPHVNMFFVKGTGTIQVFASSTAVNPFKSAPAAGGGGTVDAYTKTESDDKYAQKTDVVPYKMGMDFGTCTTAAETVIKSVTTLHKVAPALGAVFAVKFNNAVPAQARLNINGLTGYIQYRGGSIPNGVINAGDIATFIYYSSSGFNTFEILSVENGGNAATVGGVGIANLRQITQTVINTLPAVPNGEGDFFVNCDTSDTSFPYWYGHLSIRYGSYTGEYVAIFRTTGDDNKVYYNTYRTNHWSGWQEISATPIKSTTFSGTTDAYSNIALWAKSENKIPILFECKDKNATVFYGKSGNFYAYVTDNLHQNVNETAVSGTVWYVKV